MSKHVAAALLVLVVGVVVFKNGSDGDSLKGRSLPSEKIDPELLVSTISRGEAVEIEDHLITGRWTVVEFGADW